MLIILHADSANLLHTSLIPKSQSFSLSIMWFSLYLTAGLVLNFFIIII